LAPYAGFEDWPETSAGHQNYYYWKDRGFGDWIFRCPADTFYSTGDYPNSCSYAINHHLRNHPWSGPMDGRLASIMVPESTLMVQCKGQLEGGSIYNFVMWKNSSTRGDGVKTDHSSGTNLLFSDGHVGYGKTVSGSVASHGHTAVFGGNDIVFYPTSTDPITRY
jgi:prepilin-type processing-associated H-X9-DG protein